MDKRLETGNVNAIFRDLQSAKEKWEVIGSGLGLSAERLQRIKRDRAGRTDQCLYAVINDWLHGRDNAQKRSVSWRTLIRTLESTKVDESTLADKIMTEKGFARTRTKNAEPVQTLLVATQVKGDSTASGEGAGGTPISDKYLKDILSLLVKVAYLWYTIGIYLGFSDGELKTIQSMPSLYTEGVEGFLREMLSRWLRWTPPTHPLPTIERLANALRKVRQVELAQTLILEWSSGRGFSRTQMKKTEPVKTPSGETQVKGDMMLHGDGANGGGLLLSYLKSLYQQETHHSKTEWPPTQDVKYINLVLVRQDKIPVRSFKVEKMSQLTQKGQIQTIVDDAEFQNSQLEIEDITNYTAHRKVIIIEGAPGVGKTTLALKLCHDWAHEELLREYSLVLYIPLRVPLARVAESVDELLKYFGDNCTHADVQWIKQSLGKKILFVLDGWDELPPSCRDQDMFFPKLIQGVVLPECNVLVTSRPGVTEDIRHQTNRQIEILGFTEQQVKQYIHSYFSESGKHDGKEVAVKLIEDLEYYPNVSSTCYIAINLTIVCYVYLVSEYQLPPTLSQVYEEFVFHAVKRHFSKVNVAKPSSVRTIEDFDSSVHEVLINLGKLALKGIQDNELSFSRDKLKELCPVEEEEVQFDGFGLLKLLHIFRKRGTETFYHFLHLTVQEYLAAYSIAQMGEDQQAEILARRLRDARYENVLKFFCGIDKFKSRQARIIFPHPKHIAVPFVLECIFEGQWEDGCRKVAECTSSSFTFTKHVIQPYRSMVIGYVMAKSGTPWDLTLYQCKISEREFRCLSQIEPTSLRRLCIQRTHLTIESMKCLALIVRSQVSLFELSLLETRLSDEALHILYEGLSDHKSLKVLELANNELTSSSSKTVICLLNHLPALRRLNLRGNSLGDSGCEEILNLASTSTSLKELLLPRADRELSSGSTWSQLN